MSQCKACGAEIKWIRTERGKQMPVDIKPITVITELGKTIRAYTPHWASCHGAEMFRKPSHEAA